MSAINAVMPGGSAGVAPFMQRLPVALRRAEGRRRQSRHLSGFRRCGCLCAARGAADAVGTAVKASAPIASLDIDALLGAACSAAHQRLRPQPPRPSGQAASRLRSADRSGSACQRHFGATVQPKIWLQLASGSDVDALADRFQRLKSQEPRPVRRHQALCCEQRGSRPLVDRPVPRRVGCGRSSPKT